MRGSDIANTPVALANLVVRDDATAQLFIADGKVGPELARHLGNAVGVLPAERFESELEALKGKRVAIDPSRTVAAVAQALERGGAQVERSVDPTLLPKAIKTQSEQQGHRDAQAIDGVAIVRFLMWIEANAPSGNIDELTAAAKLREYRGLSEELKDASFDTISAAGPHAALPHYKVDEASNIPIPPSSIYLCDSGGQYMADSLGGTTDITRTVWVGPGKPTAEMIDRNTRVLKGHIELALATFPKGTNGGQLDTLARMHLWQAGVDYGHGTGHGVGSYLSVHEGPQRISKPGGAFAGTGTPLEAGMICSNEPGYYKQGAFGIRIENLVLVVPAEIDGAEGDWLGFETLTFAPLDRTLVDAGMLTDREIDWWNGYHADVLRIIGPGLDEQERAWLEHQCRPLTRS